MVKNQHELIYVCTSIAMSAARALYGEDALKYSFRVILSRVSFFCKGKILTRIALSSAIALRFREGSPQFLTSG